MKMKNHDSKVIKLEGHLDETELSELRKIVKCTPNLSDLILDLSNVNYLNTNTYAAFLRWQAEGVQFVARQDSTVGDTLKPYVSLGELLVQYYSLESGYEE